MMDILTGTRLGGYDVRELLGSGGMAAVYRGYDIGLDREVAIKVIRTTKKGDDFVARFKREARVVARLRHPNIVQIHNFGQHENIVYMVQELLPGPTLAEQLRKMGRRRMAAERVQSIIDQLAAALDFAHAQGIIHRDVKPSNAIYNAQGQLVLTDFGIARTEAEANSSTEPGIVMGTPGYIAPEQAVSSIALTPACDIYALGVVLFELLTGRLPFEADTPMGVLLKHLYDNPPAPTALRPDLPATVDPIIRRALHKEPQDRYPSAGALADALRLAWPDLKPALSASAGRHTAQRSNGSRPAAPAASASAVAEPSVRPASTRSNTRATPATNGHSPKTSQRTTKTASQPPKTIPKRESKRTKAAAPAQPTAVPRDLWPLRVGLVTINVVALLILFGLEPDALGQAWTQLSRLFGS